MSAPKNDRDYGPAFAGALVAIHQGGGFAPADWPWEPKPLRDARDAALVEFGEDGTLTLTDQGEFVGAMYLMTALSMSPMTPLDVIGAVVNIKAFK